MSSRHPARLVKSTVNSPKLLGLVLAGVMAAIAITVLIFSRASAPTNCTKTLTQTTNIQTTLNGLVAGDVLCLHTGEYGAQGNRYNITNSGSSGSRITIRNFPGEAKPVLLGFYVVSGDYVTLSGLHFSLPTGNVTPANTGTTTVGEDVKIWLNGALGAEITDSEVEGSLWNAGIYISGSDNISITTSWIHDNGDFADSRCLNSCHGIYWGSGSGVIKSNLLEHNMAAGITLYDAGVVKQPHDVVISENTVVANLQYGIQINDGSYNVRVVDNISAYNAGEGIYGHNLQDNSNVAQNNILYSNARGNEVNYLGAGAIQFSGNIFTSPQFLYPLPGASGGDYHLKSTSPALNVGQATYAYSNDMDGVARPQGSGPDIGAYEGVSANCAAFNSYATGSWPAGCTRPFTDNSPFNRQITFDPANTSTQKLTTDSATKISYLTTGKLPQSIQANNADICPSGDYYHPYFYAKTTDAKLMIHQTQYVGLHEGEYIYVPAGAHWACSSDGHMTIIQPNGSVEDFWHVTSVDFSTKVVTASAHGRSNLKGDGLQDFTTTAAWFSNLAGIMRAQELEAGQINHALFAIIRCSDGTAVFPAHTGTTAATCSGSGIASGGNSLPMGARLWLAMTDTQINALSEPSWKKVMLKAMSHYGMIIGDTGGSTYSFGIEVESGTTYTAMGYPDQVAAWAAKQGFTSRPSYLSLGDILDSTSTSIWSKYLKVVDPCVSSGTCPSTDTVAPTGSITVPSAGVTVSGTTQTVTASASDNVGVAGVQIKLDGANLGSEVTTGTGGNYSTTWNTTTATNAVHLLTATIRDAAGNSFTTSAVSVTVSNILTCNPAQNLGNINCDTRIDIYDLSILLSNYGKTPAQSSYPQADLNGNGLIDVFDLSILLSHFGT